MHPNLLAGRALPPRLLLETDQKRELPHFRPCSCSCWVLSLPCQKHFGAFDSKRRPSLARLSTLGRTIVKTTTKATNEQTKPHNRLTNLNYPLPTRRRGLDLGTNSQVLCPRSSWEDPKQHLLQRSAAEPNSLLPPHAAMLACRDTAEPGFAVPES